MLFLSFVGGGGVWLLESVSSFVKRERMRSGADLNLP